MFKIPSNRLTVSPLTTWDNSTDNKIVVYVQEKNCFFAEHCPSIDFPWLFMLCYVRLKWRVSQSTLYSFILPFNSHSSSMSKRIISEADWKKLPIPDTNNRNERIINRIALHYWPTILICDHDLLFLEWELYVDLFDPCFIFLGVYCVLSFLQHLNSSVTTLPAF